MAEGVWKGVYPQVFGRSKQLSLNKFFDPSTPSMRKGRDGEKKTKFNRTKKHLKAKNFLQLINEPTHIEGHLLDQAYLRDSKGKLEVESEV